MYQGNLAKPYGEFGLQISYTHAQGSLFGGAANGPFSVESSETLSTLVGGELKLNPTWSLAGSYALAQTKVQAKAGSLLSQFSTLYSSASSLGLHARSLWARDDHFQFNIRQPIRFDRGDITLNVPTGLDRHFMPLFSQERINLNNLGAIETQYELSYVRALSKQSSLNLRWLKHRNRITHARIEGLSLAYSLRF